MFQEQQMVSSKRDEKILEDLTQIKQDQQDMMQSISTNVTENVSKLVDMIEATTSKQQSVTQEREEKITSSVNEMLQNIEASISKQKEDDIQRNRVVVDMLQNIQNENKLLIQEMSSTVSGQMGSLNDNSQQLFEKLITRFDDHIDKVKSNVDAILGNLKTEVQNIDVIMSSASKQLIGLPSHLEKVSQSTDKLLTFSDDMKKSTASLIQFNQDFTSTQENLDNYSQNIVSASSELKLADTILKETLQTSKQLLIDMKNQFGDLAEKNSDTVDEFALKVDKFMNEYHKHVEKAMQDTVIHQLDNSLSAYAQTMAEAITSLSDAIEELREKETR
jgi:ElaB/YqjD/DUF883 family membrane-anchored ribosome-binding protein